MEFSISHRAVRKTGYITHPTVEAKGQTLSRRKSGKMLIGLFEGSGKPHLEVWVGNDFSPGSRQHAAASEVLGRLEPQAVVLLKKEKGGILTIVKHELEKNPELFTQEHWNQFGKQTGFAKITKGNAILFQNKL